MDCEHARLLLTFARDRAALDPDEADRLDQHLKRCRDCAALAAGEERLDTALAQTMRDVPVPAGLKTRLLARLHRPRRLRRWILSGAAAAVLLLGVGLAWRLYLAPRPAIDFENLPLLVYKVQKPASAEEVEDWFKSQHELEMSFPPGPWNLQKLDSCSVAYFQGQRVPKLEFVSDGHVVHVYVLSDRTFEVSKSTAVPSHLLMTPQRSMATINHNGYLYLVVYTGGALQAFQ